MLANGGFLPYNSFLSDINEDSMGYNVGGILGFQIYKYFAIELGYSYNSIYNKQISGNVVGYGTYTLEYDIVAHDIKINFLFQYPASISEDMYLIPYIGIGSGVSVLNSNLKLINTDESLSESKSLYAFVFKTGLKYRYSYFVVGAGLEVVLRSSTSWYIDDYLNTVAINFDLGFIF